MNAIPGGTVCRYHGGLAPQVQRKAIERLAEIRDKAIIEFLQKMADGEVGPPTLLAAIRDLHELIEKSEERDFNRQSGSVVDEFLAVLKSS